MTRCAGGRINGIQCWIRCERARMLGKGKWDREDPKRMGFLDGIKKHL